MTPSLTFDCAQAQVTAGTAVTIAASPALLESRITRRKFLWATRLGSITPSVFETDQPRAEVAWDTTSVPLGTHEIHCTIIESDERGPLATLVGSFSVEVLGAQVSAESSRAAPPPARGTPPPPGPADGGAAVRVTELPPVSVALRRASVPATHDVILWILIRASTENISFRKYQEFIGPLLCGDAPTPVPQGAQVDGRRPASPSSIELPFPGVDAYRLLKVATEAFLKTRCGVHANTHDILAQVNEAEERTRAELPRKTLEQMLRDYLELVPVRAGSPAVASALPYLALIREKLPEIPLVRLAEAFPIEGGDPTCADEYVGIIAAKLRKPCFVELLWCFWIEQGLLVQTMNRISQRFMNIRGEGFGPPREHGDRPAPVSQ